MEIGIGIHGEPGRAIYLGERNKGHQAPRATSTHHLFAAAVDAETGSPE